MAINVREIEQYIREAARQRGIDPDIAVRVAKSEGLGEGIWQSNYHKNGRRETSYGPYQLLVGGGLGDKFQQQTGLSASDPSSVYQQVDFALDEASQGGWSPWYGAAKVGVGQWDGLRGSRQAGISQVSAPSMPEFEGPMAADKAPLAPWIFGQMGVPMESGGVDPVRFGSPAMPFTPQPTQSQPPQSALPDRPMPMGPMSHQNLGPMAPPAPKGGGITDILGAMAMMSQPEQPQFSPVNMQGPSPEQAQALSSFVSAIKQAPPQGPAAPGPMDKWRQDSTSLPQGSPWMTNPLTSMLMLAAEQMGYAPPRR